MIWDKIKSFKGKTKISTNVASALFLSNISCTVI